MGTMDQYKIWMKHPYFDAETRSELAAIAQDHKEIEGIEFEDISHQMSP